MYINNDFLQYFKRAFTNQRAAIGPGINAKWNWALTIIAFLGTILQVSGQILKDAAIEIVFIVIFGIIVLKMSQGRDLIVSMFEPGGLYEEGRIFYTVLALLALSLSMWIIPAAVFEWRQKVATRTAVLADPFDMHLFFAHRILPLIPFWLMAFALFNDKGWFFTGLAIAEVCLFSFAASMVKKRKARIFLFLFVFAVMAAFVVNFVFNYRVEYLYVKRVLAVILYLLSILVFMLYYDADKKLLDEHFLGNKQKSPAKRYLCNTRFYVIYLLVHLVLVTLFINVYFEIAPESMLLYVFALYVFIIDFIYYLVGFHPIVRTIATSVVVVVVLFLIYDVLHFNTHHYTVDRDSISNELATHSPLSLDDYYEQWKTRIPSDTTLGPYPIILVAGEGGGSRAGFWFSQNLIDFDHETKGKFREHIFSISTVSGSTVGLSTYFAYLDQPLAQKDGGNFVLDTFLCLPEKVYQTNFVGSSISGLFIVDLFHSLLPGKPTEDRNNVLMKQESKATRDAIRIITGKDVLETPLDQEYMSVFYDKNTGYRKFRTDHPLALINTTRSNDGRRGIYAPIKLDSSLFNDAIDINSYLYKDSLWVKLGKKKKTERNDLGIKFGVACVSSELFPILSAPLYIDSLGSFVDGGYHENSGLKTTLDVYNRLKELLIEKPLPSGRNYEIYILYLKNGGDSTDLYGPQPSVLPILQPLSALIGQPFNGSASYFEERAKYIADTADKSVFIKVALNSRMLTEAPGHFQDRSRYKRSMRDRDPWYTDSLHESKIQDEIFADLLVKQEKGRTDTVLNFPLARWLSHSVIRRMKKNQQRLKADTTTGVKALLRNVIAAH